MELRRSWTYPGLAKDIKVRLLAQGFLQGTVLISCIDHQLIAPMAFASEESETIDGIMRGDSEEIDSKDGLAVRRSPLTDGL